MIKVLVSAFDFVVAVVFGLQLFIVWLVKKITKRRKVVPYLLFFPYNPQLTAPFFLSLIIITNAGVIHNIENNSTDLQIKGSIFLKGNNIF